MGFSHTGKEGTASEMEGKPRVSGITEASRIQLLKEGWDQMKSNKNRHDHWFTELMEITGDP